MTISWLTEPITAINRCTIARAIMKKIMISHWLKDWTIDFSPNKHFIKDNGTIAWGSTRTLSFIGTSHLWTKGKILTKKIIKKWPNQESYNTANQFGSSQTNRSQCARCYKRSAATKTSASLNPNNPKKNSNLCSNPTQTASHSTHTPKRHPVSTTKSSPPSKSNNNESSNTHYKNSNNTSDETHKLIISGIRSR